MSKFEYKIYNYNNGSSVYIDLEKELNGLGEQGWELVSTTPIVSGEGYSGELNVNTGDINFVFKRQL